jgi:hypothetical protein
MSTNALFKHRITWYDSNLEEDSRTFVIQTDSDRYAVSERMSATRFGSQAEQTSITSLVPQVVPL